MRTSVTIAFIILSTLQVAAQSDSTSSHKKGNQLHYFNSLLVGGLFGEGKRVSFTASTTHGIRLAGVSLGAGIGYDAYLRWEMMQLYGCLEYELFNIKNNLAFINVSGGYSKASERELLLENQKIDADGGSMFNAMLGYKIKSNKLTVYFATGYKLQRLNYSYGPIFWWDSTGTVPPPITTVKETSGTIVIQIGFGLN